MDTKNYISTHWVPSEVGEQLKFAVPTEGENIDGDVNVVDEIREEIMNRIDEIIAEDGASLFASYTKEAVECYILAENIVRDEVEKIFEKYLK